MSHEVQDKLKDKDRILELIKTSLSLFKGPILQLGDNYITGEYNMTSFNKKSFCWGLHGSGSGQIGLPRFTPPVRWVAGAGVDHAANGFEIVGSISTV